MKKSYIIVWLLFLSSVSNAQIFDPNNNLIKLNQISFTENRGQVKNEFSSVNNDVLFYGNDGNMNFFLTSQGVYYQSVEVNSWDEEREQIKRKNSKIPDCLNVFQLNVEWLGIQEDVTIIKNEAIVEKKNFYLNNNIIENVSSYSNITYCNLYPNIDLKWYSNEKGLKYDYIVKPNGDINRIKLKINGAEKIEILDNGNVKITTVQGIFEEEAPYVYQENTKIEAEWKLDGDILSFQIADYDVEKDLVIDPMIRLWGTYYGGAQVDEITDGAYTNTNHLYVIGETYSPTAISFNGSGVVHQLSYTANRDGFIVKFDANGTRIWSGYFGGASDERAEGIAVNSNGDIYVSGYTQSTSGITSLGAHQTSHGGGGLDGYLIKFNSNGQRLWATYYGGNGEDYAWDCSLDGSENIFIAGYSSSFDTGPIGTAGTHQQNKAFRTDAFVAKFNASGIRQWGSYFGGNGEDLCWSCSADNAGNVYLTGWTTTRSGGIAGGSYVYQPSHANPSSWGDPDAEPIYDAFIVKFNSTGTRDWSTYYGGTGFDWGRFISVNSSNDIFITGYTNSPSGIATSGTHQTTIDPSYTIFQDAFILKFNTSGNRVWGTYYGGNSDDNPLGCASDMWGNVYMSGYTNSTTGIATTDAFNTTLSGGNDAFLVLLNNSGNRIWGTYYGGPGNDQGANCFADNLGNSYLVGTTYSFQNDTMSTVGAHQSSLGGDGDGFVVKFNSCTNIILPSITNLTASEDTICIGTTTTLSLTGTLGSATTWEWYTGSCNGSLVGTGTSINVSPTTTTTYYVRGMRGCVTNGACQQITVVVNPIPNVTAAASVTNVCNGSSTILTGGGATSYTWSGGVVNGVPFFPLSSGVYTVTGNSLGCTNTATVAITIIPKPTVTISAAPSTTICSGNSITLSASGALTYSWSGGISNGVPFTPTASGIYSVIGTASNGCRDTTEVIVTVNTTPTLNTAPILVESNCGLSDGALTGISVNGLGPFSYTWYNSLSAVVGTSSNLTSVPSGVYTVHVTDLTNGCVGILGPFSVSDLSAPPAPILSTDSVLNCEGSAINVTSSTTAISPVYSWSGPAGYTGSTSSLSISSSTVSMSGNYCLTVTQGICTSLASCVNIQINPNPILDITTNGIGNYICPNDSLTVVGSGALSYNWSGPAGFTSTSGTFEITNASSSDAGLYILTGTSNGCNSIDSITIILGSTPIISSLLDSNIICTDSIFIIDAGSGFTNYLWNTFDTTQTIVVSSSGTYSVEVQNNQGCSAIANTTVIFSTPFDLEIFSNTGTGICEGDTFYFYATGAITYSWSGPNVFSSMLDSNIIYSINMNNEGTYTVIGYNNEMCSQTESVYLNVLPISDCLFIPEFISPNDDGKNDGWDLEFLNDFPNHNVQIYNRWGSLLFEQKPYVNFNGVPNTGVNVGEGKLPVGTYFYLIDLGIGSEMIKGYLEIQY